MYIAIATNILFLHVINCATICCINLYGIKLKPTITCYKCVYKSTSQTGSLMNVHI